MPAENTMNSKLVAGFLLTCILVALTACSDQGSGDSSKNAPVVEPADFVFTNGKVYTVDKDNSWAEAVARNVKLMSAFGT